MILSEWRKRKEVYKAREKREVSDRTLAYDPNPYDGDSGVQAQAIRDLLDRVLALERKLKVKEPVDG